MNPTDKNNERRGRGPEATRVPFEALVEIAAHRADGDRADARGDAESFEAESVDLSTHGMHLRTTYLPPVGAPLTFRFDAIDAQNQGQPTDTSKSKSHDLVMAHGEVVWAQDGEFGVRFTDVASPGVDIIQRLVGGMAVTGFAPGAAVRIHIEGQSSPMRAHMRDEGGGEGRVDSELKMLRIGACVELEDKEHHTRKSARIDHVGCEIDPESKVPRLVVRLRYSDATAKTPAPSQLAGHASLQGPSFVLPEPFVSPRLAQGDAPKIVLAADLREPAIRLESVQLDSMHHESVQHDAASPVRQADTRQPETTREVGKSTAESNVTPDSAEEPGVFAARMKQVGGKVKDVFTIAGSAAGRFGLRAKNTIAMLGKRQKSSAEVDEADADAPSSRTAKSSSHEAGHEAGRRTADLPKTGAAARTLRPQGAARGQGLGSSGDSGQEETKTMEDIDSKKALRRKQIGIAAGAGIALMLGIFAFRKPAQKPLNIAPTPELAPLAANSMTMPAPEPSIAPVLPVSSGPAIATLAGDPTGIDSKGVPNPFGTASVKKGTKMLIKLDGPISELRGLQMANGFVVSVPNRKSLDGASPLAAKDTRVSSSKIVNNPTGAELTVSFKDTPPSYVVRVKGDSLEVILSHDKAVAKKGKGKTKAAKKVK